MILPISSEDRESIAELCRRFHVERLELFGSATDARFDPHGSDLDFLVSFEPGATDLNNYLGLVEGLEARLGKEVDLVIERSIRNPYFRKTVNATRRLIYAHREQEVAV
jgi:predicted nucleotidyltransferase